MDFMLPTVMLRVEVYRDIHLSIFLVTLCQKERLCQRNNKLVTLCVPPETVFRNFVWTQILEKFCVSGGGTSSKVLKLISVSDYSIFSWCVSVTGNV